MVVCKAKYSIFYVVINNNYIFSEDVKNKCREILDYDISLSQMYNNVSNYFVQFQQKYIEKQNKEEQQEQSAEPQTNEENVENQSVENNENEAKLDEVQNDQQTIENSEEVTEQTEENIGGTVEQIEIQANSGEAENLTEEEQMKKDAEEIKSKISFIKPLSGTITSVFGWRNPKSSTVSKYHTGIDIARDEGVEIISATNGKVALASSEGAYGNHLKIVIDDVTIIYAHCSSLLVKQDDEILQGQTIAKVGSTGNSTGPHLHFEIRKEDRYVDPSLILDF